MEALFILLQNLLYVTKYGCKYIFLDIETKEIKQNSLVRKIKYLWKNELLLIFYYDISQ